MRKIIVATGIITTIAGNGTGASTGDGGPATAASIKDPKGVAIDDTGNAYVSEYEYGFATPPVHIRKIDTAGIISTYAGGVNMYTTDPGYPGDGRRADSAYLHSPWGLCFDTCGNMYVADMGACTLRKILAPYPCTDTTGDPPPTLAGELVRQISVFPNPATGTVQIKGLTQATHYRLLDIAGATMATGFLQANNKEINVADYAPGIYIFEFRDDTGKRNVLRLMKE